MPADPPPTPRFSRALSEHLREQATGRRRRRFAIPPLRAAVAVCTVLAALAFVIGSAGGAGEQQRHSSTDLPELRVSSDDLLDADREEINRLKREFRLRGAVLGSRDRWVKNPKADGRVFSVQMPKGIGSKESVENGRRVIKSVPFKVDDKLPGAIIVVIGKAGGKKPKRDPRTIYEAIPQLCDLVDPTDPDGTLEALRDAGFDVIVTSVPWKTKGLEDVVISVLDGEGRYRGVDPETKQLVLEVGTPGEGHGGTRDGSCR